MGTLTKYFLRQSFGQSQTISPAHIFHEPSCLATIRNWASRPDFFDETFQTRDVDCVISTSELMKMIEEKLMDKYSLLSLPRTAFDSFLSLESSGIP